MASQKRSEKKHRVFELQPKRSILITLPATPEERDRLKHYAKLADMTQAEFMRLAINELAEKISKKKPKGS